MSERFKVHLEQLWDILDRIGRFDQQVEHALEDVEARVGRLQATWTGQAAQAHQSAHDEWKHGLAQMREALNAMRQAAATAHGNYSDAATTNASMWKQVL